MKETFRSLVFVVCIVVLCSVLFGCTTDTNAFSSNSLIASDAAYPYVDDSHESTTVSMPSNDTSHTANEEQAFMPQANNDGKMDDLFCYESYLKKIWVAEDWDGKAYLYPISFFITSIENGIIEGRFSTNAIAYPDFYVYDFDSRTDSFVGTVFNGVAECLLIDGRGNKAKTILHFTGDSEIEVDLTYTERNDDYVTMYENAPGDDLRSNYYLQDGRYSFRPYNITDIETDTTIKTQSIETEFSHWGKVSFTAFMSMSDRMWLTSAFLVNEEGDVLYEFSAPFQTATGIIEASIGDINGDGLSDVYLISGFLDYCSGTVFPDTPYIEHLFLQLDNGLFYMGEVSCNTDILDKASPEATPVFPPLPSEILDIESVGVTNERLVELIDDGTIPGDVKALNLSGNMISDLTPLSALTELTYLVLSNNEICDLTPLQLLTNLSYLYLGYNEIVDLGPLSALTKLTDLNLHANQISDISHLHNLVSLENLSLSDNRISDITQLQILTKLTYLNLSENTISDISPLHSLINLADLALRGNQISDLSPLETLVNLEWLILGENRIIDLLPLKSLTNLTALSLWSNLIEDLSPLQALTNLTDLIISDNDISDLSPIKGLHSLTGLSIGGGSIVDLTPLMPLTGLVSLSVSNTRVSDLSPLEGLTSLVYLFLPNNQISDLSPLRGLTSLSQQLVLSGNLITDVTPLSALTELSYLDISDNQISDFTILQEMTSLRWLVIRENQLSESEMIDLQERIPYCTIY